MNNNKIEEVAALQHVIWGRWMEYMFSKREIALEIIEMLKNMSNKAKRTIKAGFHVYPEKFLDQFFVIMEHQGKKCSCESGIFDYQHMNYTGGRTFIVMKCDHCGKTEHFVVDEKEIDEKSRLIKLKPQWETEFLKDVLAYENKRIVEWLDYIFENAVRAENGDFIIPQFIFDEYKLRSQRAFITEFSDRELFDKIKSLIAAVLDNEDLIYKS